VTHVPVLLTLATVVSTLLGGALALRARNQLHLVLGAAAGIMLGVVAFELIPEIGHLSTESGRSLTAPMVALVAGFLVLHVLERSAAMHGDHGHYEEHAHPNVGLVSALALCAHSVTDGIGIGLAFQAGEGVGVTVALAVIAHDCADGLNTVTLMRVSSNTRRRSLVLLALDALAPLVGVLLTLLVTVPESALRIYLGVFAGVLLYLATSDILPEAHARHPSRLTFLTTAGGAAAMFAIAQAAL